MELIPIRLHGFIAKMSPEYKRFFVVKDSQLVFEPKIKRRIKKDVTVPLYREMPTGDIAVPFGIIMHYNKVASTQVRFKVIEREGDIPFAPLSYDHPAIAALSMDDWQRRALDSAQYARGGLLEAPTGAGKSRPLTALAIAAACQHNVLFASAGVTIEENFLETFGKVKHLLGDIQLVDYDQYRHNPERYPTTGCIIYAGSKAVLNDFMNSKSELDSVGTLIADEAHHGGSETYQNMLYALPNLVRSLGLSATLFEGKSQDKISSMRISDACIIGAHGPLLLRVTPQEVKHRIDLPDVANLRMPWMETDITYKGNDWPKIYKMIQAFERRNDTISSVINALSAHDRVTVVPISNKEYGIKLMERCFELGGTDKVVCWYGNGELHTRSGLKRVDIADMKDYIESGRYNTVIVTSHVDESLDLPAIDTAFLTEGRKARRSRQRAGRSVRRGKDSKSLVINLWDLDDGVMQSQASFRCNTLVNYYETKKYRFDTVPELVEYFKTL